MAKNDKETKVSTWDKICDWYAGQATLVGMVYSLGAAVVIVGALFKILHLPGASVMLFAGMMTEALLFTMGIFEKPHATYHWEHVYPQLIEEEGAEHPAAAAGAAVANAPVSVPSLQESDVKALKEGIANVAASANALADLGKLAEGSNKLGEKLAAATVAADKFAAAQTGLVEGAAKLGENYNAAAQASAELGKNTEAVAKNVAAAAQNVASLNAAYEVELKAAQAGQKDAEAFAVAQAKLASQVADLNKIYGNMLSAIA